MIVAAMLSGDVNSGAQSEWTVLEDDDLEQIAWECGRQVRTFVEHARNAQRGLTMTLMLQTSKEPDGIAGATPRE